MATSNVPAENMAGTPVRRDRRHLRHEATRREILDTAWAIVRVDGLASLSLRALARAVGIEPQSLYTYFRSKNAVYDAMFLDGNRELLERLDAIEWPDDPREILRMSARVFVEFSADDAARHQLLFQRTIPDFQPSPDTYAVAVTVFERMRSLYATAGLSDPLDFDLWTAVVSGLAAQQLSNDPAGERYLRLIDKAVDMYADQATVKPVTKKAAASRSRCG
jgi:AcrR family transcriptional regulator